MDNNSLTPITELSLFVDEPLYSQERSNLFVKEIDFLRQSLFKQEKEIEKLNIKIAELSRENDILQLKILENISPPKSFFSGNNRQHSPINHDDPSWSSQLLRNISFLNSECAKLKAEIISLKLQKPSKSQ